MGVRKEWEAHGFKCRVLDSPLGEIYNGYVAVPKDHPYWGQSYWDFGVDVHGGVTFADFGRDEPDKKCGEILWPDPELYWIGFDTAHLGDWIPYQPDRYGKKWSIEDVARETEQMALQLRQKMEGAKLRRELTEEESKKLLRKLSLTIEDLEGVKIPLNIIERQIKPLKEWLDSELS